MSLNFRREIVWGSVFFMMAAALQGFGAFAGLERPVRDAEFMLLRSVGIQPVANDLVLVAIDDEFLESIAEPLALIHPHLGRLMSGLAQVQPSVVGLDLVLPLKSYREMQSPQVKDYDLALLSGLHALSKVSPIILSQAWDGGQGRFIPILPAFVTVARHSAKGVLRETTASAIVCEDADSIVRSFPGVRCQPTRAAVPLAARMAAQLGNVQDWSGEINFALGEPMRPIRFAEVLQWLEHGATEKLRSAFAGKAVLIGGVFSFDDRHLLPVPLFAAEPDERKIPGLLLQAQIWRSIMNSGLVSPLPVPLEVAWVGSAAVAVARRTGPAKILLACLAIVALAGVALYCLSTMALLLPWAAWSAMLLTALLVRGLADLNSLLRNRREMSEAFSGYVGPRVLHAIERGELKPGLGGELREVCVLFAHLRGFTQRAAGLAPVERVRLANRFFAVTTPAIQDAGGTVDRYLGDGLMALFGAPQSLDDSVRHALEAAQEALLNVEQLNQELLREGGLVLNVGFGLDFGEVLVGHMGAAERHEYTAVGLTVDAAARLEAFGHDGAYPIIISAAVAKAMGLRAAFDDLGTHEVPGLGAMPLYGWKPKALNPLPEARCLSTGAGM